jgi:hypothetical protein
VPPKAPEYCEILYGIGSGNLTTIDVQNEMQSILGMGVAARDIAFDVAKGVIQSIQPPSLCQIDPVTAETIGCIGQFPGDLDALEFVNGVLYGMYRKPDDPAWVQSLVTIDTDTGAFTEIGDNSSWDINELAYDNATGIMWGLGGELRFPALGRKRLVTIDLKTAEVRSAGIELDQGTQSIAFGPDGKLYGSYIGPASASGYIFCVDPYTGEQSGPLFGAGATAMTCGPVIST